MHRNDFPSPNTLFAEFELEKTPKPSYFIESRTVRTYKHCNSMTGTKRHQVHLTEKKEKLNSTKRERGREVGRERV